MTSPTPEVFHASKRNSITRMRFLLIAILLGTPAVLIAANGLSTFNAIIGALAAGLAFARGASPAEIRRIFREIPARLAGLTCEGAEPACGRKARRAFRAVAAQVLA